MPSEVLLEESIVAVIAEAAESHDFEPCCTTVYCG